MEREVVDSSTHRAKAKGILRDYALWILAIWVISLLMHHTHNQVKQSIAQSHYDEIASRQFEDYIEYHDILPSEDVVSYSSPAFFKSDSEVKKVPFNIEWRESIECDHKPYDSLNLYEFYAQATTTQSIVTTKRNRWPIEVLREKHGYPATSVETGKPIVYPMHDADCRLRSDMRITVELGIMLRYHRVSRVAKIRGGEF